MIRLTIQVTDIDNVIQLYSYIRLYISDSENGTYTHLAYIVLIPDQTTYTYDDVTGTTDTWYKSSYYSSAAESSMSDPAHGISPSLFHNITYPEEFTFDTDQSVIIRKIRRYIGDFKKLSRMYLEDCERSSCNFIHADGKTIELEEKGWPVYISLKTESDVVIDKTSSIDPVVQGYKYMTFSGTLSDSTGCDYDTIDVWYYTFKFSDREIYEAYGDAMLPANVPSDSVTTDHLILRASIDLLENMTSEDMIDDGAQITDDQSQYNPAPGLAERDKTIKRLQKMLDDLISEVLYNAVYATTGILID
jgi:hypothetical protein